MLRIIGTLIGTAMVQFRVPSNRERERGRGKERRVVHTEANLITKYGCQILAESFHPVHVRAIRVYAKVRERERMQRRGEGNLHYSTVRLFPSLLYVMRSSWVLSFSSSLLLLPPWRADPSGMYLFNEPPSRYDGAEGGGGGFTSDKPDKFRPTNVLPDTN